MTHCWNFDGFIAPNGYGRLWDRGTRKKEYAHRFFYRAFVGEIPAGMQVNHKCDNPACVNPDHLVLGTPKDNSQDALKKGRLVSNWPDNSGENYGAAKLTWKWVSEIRRAATMGLSQVAQARIYGVSHTAIYHVLNNRWGL
jgi:hypothetical protein